MIRLGGFRLQEKAKVLRRKRAKGRIGAWMVVTAQTSVSQSWQLVRGMTQVETSNEPQASGQNPVPSHRRYQCASNIRRSQSSVVSRSP